MANKQERMINELKKDFVIIPRSAFSRKSTSTAETYHIMDCIVKHLFLSYGCTKESLRSKSRRDKLPEYRHIFCWMMVMLQKDVSWENVGRYIEKHHASAIHGFNKIEDWIGVGNNVAFIERFKKFCLGFHAVYPDIKFDPILNALNLNNNNQNERTDFSSRKLG